MKHIEKKKNIKKMLVDKFSENLPDALSKDYNILDTLSNYYDILDKLSNDFNILYKLSNAYNLLDKLSNDYNLLEKLSNDYNIGIGQNVNENTFLIYVEFIRLKT